MTRIVIVGGGQAGAAIAAKLRGSAVMAQSRLPVVKILSHISDRRCRRSI